MKCTHPEGREERTTGDGDGDGDGGRGECFEVKRDMMVHSSIFFLVFRSRCHIGSVGYFIVQLLSLFALSLRYFFSLYFSSREEIFGISTKNSNF